MRLLRWSLSVALTLAVVSCGGGSTDPYDDGNNNPPPGGNQTLGGIATSAGSLNMTAGESNTLSVSAQDTQGGSIVGFSAVFSSANASIAEVSGQGAVLAVSAGSTQINVSVTIGSVTKTASVAVTVTGSLPASANIQANTDAAYPAFAPTRVVLAMGGSVTWQFGSLEHTVNFQGGAAGTPQSISHSYSTAVSRTFSSRGDYSYSCSIHSGMSGTVVVR